MTEEEWWDQIDLFKLGINHWELTGVSMDGSKVTMTGEIEPGQEARFSYDRENSTITIPVGKMKVRTKPAGSE